MKRPLTIAVTAVMTILILYACSSTIRTAKNSFVTITIGNTPNIALLKAEAATPWARAKYFLADLNLIPEAYAYIPSVIQVIVVTVTAPDITTPIVAVDNIKPGQSSTTIRIEVPNGMARKFIVDGIRGLDSNTYYRGHPDPVDLNGTDITIPVDMKYVGPGIFVDTNHPSAADVVSCGTSTLLPCKSIYYALTSRTTGTDAVVVSAGTYLPGFAAAPAPYPLKPRTALICTGQNFGTVIDYSSVSGIVAIAGAEGASIDNCRIIVSFAGVGISDDITGGQNPAKIMVNGSQVELTGNLTGGSMSGIELYNNSTVLETTITGTGSVSGSIFGIQVWGGKPSIIGSTIANLPTGIELRATSGDVSISNSFLLNNVIIGLETVSTGKPSISNTLFDGNWNGLILGAGNPRVTGSTFINNVNFGIQIVGADPEISTSVITKNYIGILDSRTTYTSGFVNDNSIYCNDSFNLSTSITTTPNYQKNAWERSTPQVNGLAVGTNCAWGDDICADGPVVPDFSNFRPAVPGACNRPPQPAKPKM